MLTTAKRWLRHTLDALRERLSAGIPIIVLEPSCLAVFRDDLRNRRRTRPAARSALPIPRIPTGQPGDLFGERPRRATVVVAEEPNEHVTGSHWPPGDRSVGEAALKPAVNPA
jgi:hypothetical protein